MINQPLPPDDVEAWAQSALVRLNPHLQVLEAAAFLSQRRLQVAHLFGVDPILRATLEADLWAAESFCYAGHLALWN